MNEGQRLMNEGQRLIYLISRCPSFFSVAVVVNSLDQAEYSTDVWELYSTVHYTTHNLSSQDIDQIKIRFEVTTADGSTYSETAYVFDLNSDKETSGSALVSVASKEAKSVKVDEVEVTIY